jgi:hypothetical protein
MIQGTGGLTMPATRASCVIYPNPRHDYNPFSSNASSVSGVGSPLSSQPRSS